VRVIINEESCSGCGVCETLCPDIFQIHEDEKSHVIEGASASEHGSCIKEAEDSCPTQSITIEE